MMITEPPHHHHDGGENVCYVCKNDLPFDMPTRLVEACIAGKLVIFAGAGISTENRITQQHTFYDQIVEALAITDADPTFPQAMSTYCDAESRSSLLQKIKHRFDYIEAFPELRLWATRFHRELGTIYPIRDIITTNWDTLFEEMTDAIPIVTPEDYAFWDLPQRKVFKIHGSMSNVGTIVATESDYEKCYRRLRSGLIGSSLKHLLATKTILFVGYSFRDADFNRIYGYLKKEMQEILPRSFIVTVDRDFPADKHKASTVIYTDGAHFLAELKRILVEQKVMFPDSNYEGLVSVLDQANEANVEMFDRLPCNANPAVIYAASYQDGLRHAVQRILARRRTGEYSDPHHFFHLTESYALLRKGAIRAREYYDAAYIEGYLNGLYCLLDSECDENVPIYYVFGSGKDLRTYEEFESEHARAAQLHRAAFAKAKKDVRNIPDSYVVHHFPFLDHGYADLVR